MQDVKQNVLFMPKDADIDLLSTAITEKFFTQTEAQNTISTLYFDTFDWRLYQKNILFQYVANSWQLLNVQSGEKIAVCEGVKPSLKMVSENFPVSHLRTILEPIVEMRAILPVVTLDSKVNCLRVLNQDKKTVVLMYLEQWTVRGKNEKFSTVRLQNIRGYEKAGRKVLTFLQQKNIIEQASLFYPFRKGLEIIKRRPGDYSSKFFVKLDPDMTGRQAACIIFKKIFEAILQNEEGLYNDIDSEFLHDFRVAIRRTRSGLTQIKSVFPDIIIQKFKEDFASLGQITGPTRDLDVYLLYEQNYKQRLPVSLQDGLHSFFLDIRAKRDQEHKEMIQKLQGSVCQQILSEWNKFLQQDEVESSKNSEISVIIPARKIIYQRYKKIIKEGNTIQPLSPDIKLHDLRIECKKLRYCLEFFMSLFPKKDIAKVMKQLKKLQTNLGDYNDLSVQQRMLLEYLNTLRSGSRRNIYLAASIGGLLTNLYHEQLGVRQNFSVAFQYFAEEKNTLLFQKLFR